MDEEEIRFIDLFGGIGGFRLGLETANIRFVQPEGTKGQHRGDITTKLHKGKSKWFSCVYYCDIDKYAVQTYNKNFKEKNTPTDITKLNPADIPDFNLICGGFPCQSFSIAGKRQGFSDTRGTLFYEICRIASEKKPRMLFLENVKGLLSHDKGNTFRVILESLDELGYDAEWQVLNSKNFGVPQSRERVFIIGHLRGTGIQQVFPIRQNDQKHDTTSKEFLTSVKHIQQTTGQIRRLTPVECERLQGFPDNWTDGVSDTQRYKQLGNAVTVNVIQAIGERILDVW